MVSIRPRPHCNGYLLNVDFHLPEYMETFFVNVVRSGAKGLESLHHVTNSTLDHRSFAQSRPAVAFLHASGLPGFFIKNRSAFANDSA